jgi:hypothetical protein
MDRNIFGRRTVAAVVANPTCSPMGWVFGHVERRHGAPVDWTEEEVEVSHSTLLSLLQLSSSLTILPSTSHNIGQTTEDTIQAEHCLSDQYITAYELRNIALQHRTTRTI